MTYTVVEYGSIVAVYGPDGILNFWVEENDPCGTGYLSGYLAALEDVPVIIRIERLSKEWTEIIPEKL